MERERIWLIEDSPLESQVLQRLLGSTYSVRAFLNGETTLEALATEPAPELLIADWELPGVNGIEVCRFIRERHDQMTLPILMLTGHSQYDDVAQGLGAGANDFVRKPFHEVELLARVRSLLLIRRLTASRAEFEQHLLGIVSHDLRNPLGAVVLSAAILQRRGGLDAQAVDLVGRIQTAADRATRMIRDLLDFTQARLGGGLRIARVPVDMQTVVRRVVNEVEASHLGRDICVDVPGDALGEWDTDRLEQAVQNLLTNALKYSPTGTRVHVVARGEGEWLSVSVHNAGEPIPPAKLPVLFEPFQRATTSVDASNRSVGLGLYIVKQIVDAHRGTIDVKSTPELGTTFTMRLPRHAPRA